jgi:hypothetical protein
MPLSSLANCSFLPSLKSTLSSSHIVALKSIAREFHHRLLRQTPECSSHILSDRSVLVELQRAAVVSTFTSFCCNRVLRRSLASFSFVDLSQIQDNHCPRHQLSERSSHILSDCSVALLHRPFMLFPRMKGSITRSDYMRGYLIFKFMTCSSEKYP